MTPPDVAQGFNTAINNRDLAGLEALMTDDHTFIDTAGNENRGKAACIASWRGFFDGFPDYRNDFAEVTASGDQAIIVGRSTCSFEALHGPALWTARVRDGKVAEWRVYEDTPSNRQLLQIA